MPASPRARAGDPTGRTSRRSVLTAGLAAIGGLTAAACSPGSSASDGSATPRVAPAKPQHDVELATSALAEVRAVLAAAEATVRRYPATRAELAALVSLHRTHEGALVHAVPAHARASRAPAAYAVPTRRPAAIAHLAARERQLHATLDFLAVRAQSGPFARLLASMGTAVSLRLVRLA